ncbi:MAG: tetrahydromethanopterin S-methyltransferase subunit H [Candidatus Altiarchaeota archaeon]
MVDVYLSDSVSARRRLDFVSDLTDLPILIDSTEAQVRLDAVNYVEEVGLIDRVVYNSINAGVSSEEITALRDSSISAAIVLAFNPTKSDVSARIDMLENGGGATEKGLLEIAAKCGLKKVLVDTGITRIGDGAGSAFRAIPVIKAKFGLPSGCAPHNAVSAWGWFKEIGRPKHVDWSSNAMAAMLGADFILYGPIEFSREVYEELALASNFLSEAGKEMGLRIPKDNPFRKLSY